jgi:hypothetical protein
MTTATMKMSKADLMAPPVAQSIQTQALFVGLIASVASVAGAFLSPESFYSAYLSGYVFWLGLSLGCMAILMLHHLVGGAWSIVIRRILESGMMTLPMMAILFLPILFNLPRLYYWARPGITDPKIVDIQESYLNFHGTLIRYIVYFVIWLGMAYFLNAWSTEQDTIAGQSTLRFRALSGIGMVIYSLTISFAIIDWVMSLQARWISTIYGMIFIAGEALSALCFCVIVEHVLGKRKPMSEYLRSPQVHDHGKLIFAFVMVWTYFNFSQWLIIWAGNLPDEIPWFVRRINNGWGGVALFLVLFQFAVPFAILLSQQVKKQTDTLVRIAAWIFFMRMVDIYWHVEPGVSVTKDGGRTTVPFYPTFHLSWMHFTILAGIGGLWVAYFLHNLRARPMLPINAPQTIRLLESAPDQ